MLLPERRIEELVIRTLLGWCHSGFSLHSSVRIGAQETDGCRAVAEYFLRSPFSLQKLQYQATTRTSIYYHLYYHSPIASAWPGVTGETPVCRGTYSMRANSPRSPPSIPLVSMASIRRSNACRVTRKVAVRSSSSPLYGGSVSAGWVGHAVWTRIETRHGRVQYQET
jgi:hypothetical protein